MKNCNFGVEYKFNEDSIPPTIGVIKKLEDKYSKFTKAFNSAVIGSITMQDSSTMREITSADNMRFSAKLCLNDIDEYAAWLHLLQTNQTVNKITVKLYKEDDNTLAGSVVYTDVSIEKLGGLTMCFNRRDNTEYDIEFMADVMHVLDSNGKELVCLRSQLHKSKPMLNG